MSRYESPELVTIVYTQMKDLGIETPKPCTEQSLVYSLLIYFNDQHGITVIMDHENCWGSEGSFCRSDGWVNPMYPRRKVFAGSVRYKESPLEVYHHLLQKMIDYRKAKESPNDE